MQMSNKFYGETSVSLNKNLKYSSILAPFKTNNDFSVHYLVGLYLLRN